MSFEPQKFFIGLIDFFSILLPGALLTYLLKEDVGPHLLGPGYYDLGETERWIVLLFASYLLGHLIFLVGSWLLDDHFYDWIRPATPAAQVRLLAEGKPLPGRNARRLARLFFKKNVDQPFHQALRIKEHHLNPIEASESINVFQWCKARLTMEQPEALATVQRFEADSKFFRSLCVVLCVIIPWGLFTGRYALALAGVLLLVAAIWRYVDQRVKATNQAYWYIITLESQQKGKHRLPARSENGASHAGGVVYRATGQGVQYLLVQASRAPGEWVLPKGHIESGEPPAETAVREVREETGVWAQIRGELGEISFTVGQEHVTVAFYLMQHVEDGCPSDRGRVSVWLALDAAIDRATHRESQRLLRAADQTRSADAATRLVQSA